LNYVTHRPRLDREFSLRTQHVLGSDSLYSTFSSVDGTVDRLGYYAYFNHRQSDGFRQANSDYNLNTGSAKLVLDAKTDSRWVFSFDGYSEEHGEPGGLTLTPGANAVQYQLDRDASSRLSDRFELDRYFASLGWEKDFSEDSLLKVTGWVLSTSQPPPDGRWIWNSCNGQCQRHRESGVLYPRRGGAPAARLGVG